MPIPKIASPAAAGTEDWSAVCAAMAVGSLCALAAAAPRELLKDPALRGLLTAVARECATAAHGLGLRISRRPEALAARMCRDRRLKTHPWVRALRAGRPTGAAAALRTLLAAARRPGGTPAPKLTLIAAALRRLETPHDR
ncbi:MAG: ketopantoate reductase C-terminal domain-containing protein [Elusimicrobiota bacterium]|jgi:ketopantoate reductase